MTRSASAARAHQPLHAFFASLGGSMLIAALLSDSMYSSTALMQWSNMSAWLIAAGLVLALITAIVLAIEVMSSRKLVMRWFDFALLATAAVLSIVNELVHTRDAWTTVVPTGITLSAIAALLSAVAGLRGWCMTRPRADFRRDAA